MNGRRHLLMIALDFPPAATSGALRLTSFARYLPEHHWMTSVVTTRGAFYRDNESGPGSPLPPDCQVVRAFGFDTKSVLSWRGRYLGALAFPDRALSWVADGIRKALAVCRTHQIEAIVSSSPVVSAHLIAFVVKNIAGVPWLADLRDPWNGDAPHGPLLRHLDKKLEHRLLSTADRITVVTAGMVADLGQRHGDGVRSRIRLVANGYDENIMTAALATTDRPTRFRIIHTGSCLPPNRDPIPFFRAVRLCLDRGDLPAATSIELIGTPDNAALLAEVARLRLEPQVQTRARVSHQEAVAATAGAAVLLLLQTHRNHDLCIPAKAYEYLRANRAILGIAHPNCETARLLRDFDGVTLVPPEDVEGMAAALGELYRAWAAGRADHFVRDVACYSRRRLAAELAAVLDEISATGGGSVA